jgi:4-alpha-glucanotransferase
MQLSADQKLAGVLCPVFAIRTETDLGIGDTDGVRQMVDWCHRHGLSVLQVLPINETGPDNSPYNALSSLALDPTTIATTPEELPGLTPEDFQRIAGNVETAGPVRYRLVKALKRALLEAAFPNAKVPAAFLTANRWLDDYTLYRALLDENDGNDNWESWPAEQHSPATVPAALVEKLAERRRFYVFVQWVAYRQWQAVKRYASRRQVWLMGDIPFGVSRYSADVWANRSVFDLEWSGGAPPEPFFKVDEFTAKWGQNWGIPLYNWAALRRRKFDWWRTRVGNVSKVFHLFRVDHLLGFYRIYAFPWTPNRNQEFVPLNHDEAAQRTGGRLPGFRPFADDTPEHCAANRAQGEELLRMVRAAAGRTQVVAEDLGCVPPYVPESLAQLRMPGFKIPHFLRDHAGNFVDGQTYPALSVATPATHDHDPVAKLWRGANERNDSDELNRWMKYCGDEHEPPREFNDDVHEMILRGVMTSNSWLAMFMITDLFGREERFNVPGSTGAGNWSARLHLPVGEFDRDPVLRRKMAMFGRLLRETGRGRIATT